MAVALAHHNIPVAVMDHLSPLLPGFEDCQRVCLSKDKNHLYPQLTWLFVHILKQILYHRCEKSHSPGSNDNDIQKMNPITIRVLDTSRCQVSTRFLDMCLTSGTASATAESIFATMDSVPKSRSITWSNCVGLSVDNTSVNMGRHNSIMTRATQNNPAVYMMGCPCHILHNTAQKANHSFRNVRLYEITIRYFQECAIYLPIIIITII